MDGTTTQTLPRTRIADPAYVSDPVDQKTTSLATRSLSAIKWLLRGFEVDLRSLAVFRIGLGLMALANVLVALTNVEAFYSDSGVYPRALLLGRQWESDGLWSLHLISGSVYFQAALLIAQGVAAVCMAVGYRTRLAIFISVILAMSLEARNPAIINGADVVMRLLLFWSLFLPMAARWSVDSLKSGTRPVQDSLLNLATVCLLLQVAFVYVFSSLLKSWDIWFVQAKGLFLALQLDAFATPLGVWLRSHEGLCQFMCKETVLLELAGPLLALLPFMRTQFRLAMILCFVGFHAGIAMSMDIGAFPWLMMVAWCAFLPPAFWTWLGGLKVVQRVSTLVENRLPPTRPTPCPEHVKYALKPGSWTRGFAIVCLLYVTLWNLRGLNFARWEVILPKSMNGMGFALRLDQHWSMFAPNPALEDGWLVLQAELSDGSEVNLLAPDGKLTWEKPALASADYKDSRWQKYLMNLWEQKYAQHRPWLGNYFAAKWNDTHGALSQVNSWELVHMVEPCYIDGTLGDLEKRSLWKCQSFAGK